MNLTSIDESLLALIQEPAATDDKYSRGVVGFVTGSAAYPGSALLGVQAALKCSIGMVKYVGPERVQDLILVTSPEVVCFDQSTKAGRANAWVLGSGVPANDAEQARNIELIFYRSGAIAVVDAGSLETLDFSILKAHTLLLTPHAGEMARLLNRIEETNKYTAEIVLENAPALAQNLAITVGQTVLLKGNTSHLASPSGEVRSIGPNSNHLATAGSGDVLAGILGAIAAANATAIFDWMDAAELAVRIHSEAANRAFETSVVTASDIVIQLQLVVREILAR
ncbi:MAG: hypothetical protein RL556_693 [Actinomycetota bacterium]|jgi:hydroxyethylthiazole kinase-like uncharacterized protein yjeF